MATTQELLSLAKGIEPLVSIVPTRFTSPRWPRACAPKPYESLFDGVENMIRVHKQKEKLRNAALHSVKLQAGKSDFPNGQLGRPAAADPVLLPELLGGRLLYTNI